MAQLPKFLTELGGGGPGHTSQFSVSVLWFLIEGSDDR